MKNRTLGILTLSAIGFTSLAQTSEPVIMTINGKSVYKSEFENVYHKNSGKEVNKEQKSVKEYVDLFSTFKMKVFEAEANGLDTNSAFKTELAGSAADFAESSSSTTLVFVFALTFTVSFKRLLHSKDCLGPCIAN